MMFAPFVLAFSIAVSLPADTIPAGVADSVVATAGPALATLSSGVRLGADTVPRRRKAIEVSEWYERRLTIHRYGSYAIYPLFALQALAGTQVYSDSKNAPDWAKTGHRVGATALAAVFTSNTVTGLWNLYESRGAAQGQTKRVLHSILMLASDAGFTYAGVKLSEEAENNGDKRSQHRLVAYGSMAATLSGVAVMKFWPED